MVIKLPLNVRSSEPPRKVASYQHQPLASEKKVGQRHGPASGSARAQDGDEAQGHQQHAKPGPSLPAITRLGGGKGERRRRRHRGGNHVTGGRRGRQTCIHVDLARRDFVRREPVGAFGEGAGDTWVAISVARMGPASTTCTGADGLGPDVSTAAERCNSARASTIAFRLRAAVLFSSAMATRYLAARYRTGILPALSLRRPGTSICAGFPALAVGGRPAGPRQALHFRDFRGSGRRDCRGTGIEESGKWVRRR